jgi:hypothetical protein
MDDLKDAELIILCRRSNSGPWPAMAILKVKAAGKSLEILFELFAGLLLGMLLPGLSGILLIVFLGIGFLLKYDYENT